MYPRDCSPTLCWLELTIGGGGVVVLGSSRSLCACQMLRQSTVPVSSADEV